jgi:hypothetical protein
MTEAEWLASDDPQAMMALGGLRGRLLDSPSAYCRRKLRLFACACCRQVWDSIKSTSARAVVGVAEKYADGLVNLSAMDAAERRWERNGGYEPTDVLIDICGRAPRYIVEHNLARNREVAPSLQAALLRDIFGNPFRPVCPPVACADGPVCPQHGFAWLTPTVLRIAEAIYADRDFSIMPILADALEDAGCDNAELLAHCRDDVKCSDCDGGWIPLGGPHVRGCWVLDLILGKE